MAGARYPGIRAAAVPLLPRSWFGVVPGDRRDRPGAARGRALLLADASFQIAAGRPDRPGRPQRRGQDHAGPGARRRGAAGRGQRAPHGDASATCRRTRGPATWTGLAQDRVLSGRGLDELRAAMRAAEEQMSRRPDAARRDAAVRRYGQLEERLALLGGYAAEAEAARRSPPAWDCPTGCWPSRWAPCPAGSGAGSSWPGSCSPTRRPCCWTSRPTTSTPTRSSGCATTCEAFRGGLVVISHDVGLLEAVVNKVFHLDANRAALDVYNVGWTGLPAAARDRRAAPPPRARQREQAGRRAAGPGRQDAGQGDQGQGRAEHAAPGRTAAGRGVGRAGPDNGGPAALPRPGAVRQDPADRDGPVQVLRLARGLHRRRPGRGPGLRGSSCSASTARARPRCCACWPGSEKPDTGEVSPGHGLRLGYYAQEHETLDTDRIGAGEHAHRRAGPADAEQRQHPRLVPVLRRRRRQARRGAVRRGEDPAGAGRSWSSPARTCCCSTSRPTTSTRPAGRRSSARCARYQGAIVLVTHDEGAVEALAPERVHPAARRRRGHVERGPGRPRRPRLTGHRRLGEKK